MAIRSDTQAITSSVDRAGNPTFRLPGMRSRQGPKRRSSVQHAAGTATGELHHMGQFGMRSCAVAEAMPLFGFSVPGPRRAIREEQPRHIPDRLRHIHRLNRYAAHRGHDPRSEQRVVGTSRGTPTIRSGLSLVCSAHASIFITQVPRHQSAAAVRHPQIRTRAYTSLAACPGTPSIPRPPCAEADHGSAPYACWTQCLGCHPTSDPHTGPR